MIFEIVVTMALAKLPLIIQRIRIKSNGDNNTNKNNNCNDPTWSNIIPKKISKLNQSQIRELKSQNPHIEEEIIENFLFSNPRNCQLEIISDIYQAIESGFKYIVLEAGTGTGKSVAATTLSSIIN